MTEMYEKAKKEAERIAKHHCEQVAEFLGEDLESQMGIYLAKDIEEALSQASREGEERGFRKQPDPHKIYQEGYQKGVEDTKKENNYCGGWKQGYAQAIEDAAKVSESRQFHSDYQYDIGTCDRIANEIKKLSKPKE